jgi:hypothetical protein
MIPGIKNMGAFFACLRQAKNRAIRSNCFSRQGWRWDKARPHSGLGRAFLPKAEMPSSKIGTEADF